MSDERHGHITDKTREIASILTQGIPDDKPDAEQQAGDSDQLPENESRQDDASNEPETTESETRQAADDQTVSEGEPEQPEGFSLKDLSETLDVDVAELYGVSVPISKDENATLGELKDAFKKYGKLKGEREEYDLHRTRTENELMVARRQAEQLMNMGIDQGLITPEVIKQIEDSNRVTTARENRALLSVIPSWQDKGVRQVDFEGMVEMMSGYGFSENEILNIPDHRIVKFLYDQSAARRLRKGNGKTPPANTGTTRRTIQSKVSTLQQRKSEATTRQQKSALISDILTKKVK